MDEQIRKYLDERNTLLYERLSAKYKITLTKSPPIEGQRKTLWYLNEQPGHYSIGYFEDTTTTAPFTHELLHVDLLDQGFSGFSAILPDLRDGVPNAIFLPIIGHINNVFAHGKFYQTFIEMGYKPEEFVQDFNDLFNLDQTIDQIEETFELSMLPNDSIGVFITSFFTAKDNKNPEKQDNFAVLLNYLRDKDPTLYQILDNTWISWCSSKYLNNIEFLRFLFEQTEKWYKGRNSVYVS